MKSIEIDGESVSIDRIRKALKLYKDFLDGSLEAEIVEMMK